MSIFKLTAESIKGRGTHLFAGETTVLISGTGVYGIGADIESNSAFFYIINGKNDRSGVVRIECTYTPAIVSAAVDNEAPQKFITLTKYLYQVAGSTETESIKVKVNDIRISYDCEMGAIVYLRIAHKVERIIVTQSIDDIIDLAYNPDINRSITIRSAEVLRSHPDILRIRFQGGDINSATITGINPIQLLTPTINGVEIDLTGSTFWTSLGGEYLSVYLGTTPYNVVNGDIVTITYDHDANGGYGWSDGAGKYLADFTDFPVTNPFLDEIDLTVAYTATQARFYYTLPVGYSIDIEDGDGTKTSYAGTGVNTFHETAYSSADTYTLTVSGDIAHLTYISIAGQTFVSGDVSGWRDLTDLEHVSVGTTGVSGDISNWSELTNLTYLSCPSSSVTGNVTGWSALTNLETLFCYNTSLGGNVSGWSALTNLTTLNCTNTSVTGDVSTWSALTSLIVLACSNTSVSGNVSGWSALTNLTFLNCNSTSVSGDVSSWATLPNITNLQCGQTSVNGDVSVWSALTGLTFLDCHSTSVSGDVSAWSALIGLTYLSCSSTSVSGDVSGWSALTSLTGLVCDNTSISGDISGWSALVNISYYLSFYNTSVSGDVSGFSAITGVKQLWGYNTSVGWASSPAFSISSGNIKFHDCAWTHTETNNFLLSMAGGPVTGSTIQADGTNACYTPVAAAAVVTIGANGNTLTVNGPCTTTSTTSTTSTSSTSTSSTSTSSTSSTSTSSTSSTTTSTSSTSTSSTSSTTTTTTAEADTEEWSDGVDTFRLIVRSNYLCLDQTITGTGFSGIQGTDWDNVWAKKAEITVDNDNITVDNTQLRVDED